MEYETIEALAKCRIAKAEETLRSSRLLYDNNDFTGANNII